LKANNLKQKDAFQVLCCRRRANCWFYLEIITKFNQSLGYNFPTQIFFFWLYFHIYLVRCSSHLSTALGLLSVYVELGCFSHFSTALGLLSVYVELTYWSLSLQSLFMVSFYLCHLAGYHDFYSSKNFYFLLSALFKWPILESRLNLKWIIIWVDLSFFQFNLTRINSIQSHLWLKFKVQLHVQLVL